MRIIKKIIAWLFVIVAIIGIIISIAGIAGSWAVNSVATQTTLNLLSAGQNAVTSVSNGVGRIDDRLDVTQGRIDNIDERVMNAGDELKETSLLVELIDQLIGDEIKPIIGAVQDTATTIRDTATAIDEVIQAVDNIPLVSVDRINPGENIFTQIADDITAIGTSIDEMQAEIRAKREGKIEVVVDVATSRTDEMRGRVSNVQGRLGEADARLDTTYSNLDKLKITLPRTYLLITIIINVLLIFMGIAFLSLMFHSISFIRNSDQTLGELLN